MAQKTVEELTEEAIGHPEGEELQNEHGTEVVVYDRDDKDRVIGWHKELRTE